MRLPADVVEMTRGGASAAILTLIVAVAPGTIVTDSISDGIDGPYQLTVRIGTNSSRYTMSVTGTISAS